MAFSKSSSQLAYFAVVAVAAVAMAGIMAAAQDTPQDFERLHNQARARARVGPVSWDGRLAWQAQNHADKLAGDCGGIHHHLNDDVYGPHGQNVFWGPPGGGGGGRWPRAWSAADAVASWVGEEQWYQRGANVCSAPWGKTCRHYTQVVWRGTTRIGCARVECAAGPGGGGRGGGHRGVVIVCNYDPRGNVYGQPPY